jgi:predicted membrane protein
MIKKIITTVLLAVYKVLALFNLQPAIFILISGLIVFLTGSFVTYPVLKTVFLIAIAFSVLYAVLMTVCKVFGLDQKKNNSKIQIVNEKTKEEQPKAQPTTSQSKEPITPSVVPTKIAYPIYSRVNNHPNLIMAEFEDRFELYKKENGKLIRLRQDYKGK